MNMLHTVDTDLWDGWRYPMYDNVGILPIAVTHEQFCDRLCQPTDRLSTEYRYHRWHMRSLWDRLESDCQSVTCTIMRRSWKCATVYNKCSVNDTQRFRSRQSQFESAHRQNLIFSWSSMFIFAKSLQETWKSVQMPYPWKYPLSTILQSAKIIRRLCASCSTGWDLEITKNIKGTPWLSSCIFFHSLHNGCRSEFTKSRTWRSLLLGERRIPRAWTSILKFII